MYAALAIATGITPSVLMAEDDDMIDTMIDILEEHNNGR